MIFNSYVASIGPGVSVTENRKNCQLNLDITYPGGFQYFVFSANYRGYAAIDKGVTGALKSTYYISGQTAQVIIPQSKFSEQKVLLFPEIWIQPIDRPAEYDFVGPVDSDYLKYDTADSTPVIWSPCGAEGMLNINSQVRLTSTNSSSSSLLTTDSPYAKSTQIVYVNWQTCTS